MQYLNIHLPEQSVPKRKPFPEQELLSALKYLIHDSEWDYLYLSSNPEPTNPDHILIGEL